MSSRRTFIKGSMQSAAAAAVAATCPAVAASGSNAIEREKARDVPLIGRISISRSGLPAEFWDANSRAATIIAETYSNKLAARELLEDPAKFMKASGIDLGSPLVKDELLSLLAVTVDPAFSQLVSEKNYASVFRLLEASGLNSGFNPSALKIRIRTVLKMKSKEVEQMLGSLRGNKRELSYRLAIESGGHVSPEDLAVVKDIFSANLSTRGEEGVVALSVAALYVTVAAYVVLWVAVGAWVFTSGPDDGSTEHSSVKTNESARVAKLDPDLMQDYERVLKIAILSGDRNIAHEGMLRLIKAESVAIVGALRECGYLAGPQSDDKALVDIATRYAARAAGVGA